MLLSHSLSHLTHRRFAKAWNRWVDVAASSRHLKSIREVEENMRAHLLSRLIGVCKRWMWMGVSRSWKMWVDAVRRAREVVRSVREGMRVVHAMGVSRSYYMKGLAWRKWVNSRKRAISFKVDPPHAMYLSS